MDAMFHEDVAYMANKPNFKKIMEKRAEVEGVLSIYPASTYPAHTTLVTGCYPAKHGVYSNFPLRTVTDGISHWPLYSKSVFAEDLFAAAKRAGCTTAAVYWPITGCNPNIDHVINEYFFYYPDDCERIEEIFAEQGSDEVALQAVRENLQYFPREEEGQPPIEERFDSFIMGCTCSLIRNVQPDVLLLHNCLLDTMRHRCGAFGEPLKDALDQMDEWLGDVIEAMEDAGVYEQTNFVIISDHGHLDVSQLVNMNVLLRQGGFIEVAKDETIYNWQAYAQANGVSTTIHLIDHSNQKLYDRVYAYLLQLQEEGKYGIEKVFTKAELAERYNQNGPYSFMIEAKNGTAFMNNWTGEPVTLLPEGCVKGKHGHMPEKGPQPVFLAHGPAFKENAVLEKAKLVDVAPTLAAVLGQTLPEADGRCMTELLKEAII